MESFDMPVMAIRWETTFAGCQRTTSCLYLVSNKLIHWSEALVCRPLHCT